jgi:hypothetical protein
MSNENLGLGKDWPNGCAEVATKRLIEASDIQHAQQRIDRKTLCLLEDAIHGGLVDRFVNVEVKHLKPNEMPVISHPCQGEDGALGLKKTYVPNIVRYTSQSGVAANLLDCVTQLHDAVRNSADAITQPTIYIVYFDPVLEDDAWVLTAGVCVITNDGVEHFGARNVDKKSGWMNLEPAKSDDDIVAAAEAQREHEREERVERERRRNRFMLHITVDDNYDPTPEELQEVCALFQGATVAMRDDGPVVTVTRPGIEIRPSWRVKVYHTVHIDADEEVEVTVKHKRKENRGMAIIARKDGTPIGERENQHLSFMAQQMEVRFGEEYEVLYW